MTYRYEKLDRGMYWIIPGSGDDIWRITFGSRRAANGKCRRLNRRLKAERVRAANQIEYMKRKSKL